MDAYDLPEEFAHLQAQDMGKIGFINDVVRGIRKVTSPASALLNEYKAEPKETFGGIEISSLLDRAFLFLEDCEWDSADEYCEKVLDRDPRNARAYLGKLMAELGVRKQDDLADCAQPFDENANYQKAVRFGGEKYAGILSGYIDHINARNENTRLVSTYNNAVTAMKSASSESSYKAAAETFKTIPGFKDADSLAEQWVEGETEGEARDAVRHEGTPEGQGLRPWRRHLRRPHHHLPGEVAHQSHRASAPAHQGVANVEVK